MEFPLLFHCLDISFTRPQKSSQLDIPKLFGLETLNQLKAPETPAIEERKTVPQRLHAREQISVSRPGTGCRAQAEARLLGSDRMYWMELRIKLYEAEVESRNKLNGDSVFLAVNSRWRACMRWSGLTFHNPMQLLARLPQDSANKTESLARADLMCKKSANYLNLAYSRLVFENGNYRIAYRPRDRAPKPRS
jgi:hypothetical protein